MSTAKPKKNDKRLSITQAVTSIKASIPRYAKDFAAGKAEHAVLAPFNNPFEVLAALEDREASDTRRGEIANALVVMHQSTRSQLWQSLLVVAFVPMLLGIRRRLGSLGDRERDARVLFSFIEVLSIPFIARSGAYTPVALLRATKKDVWREVFAQREKNKEWRDFETFDDETCEAAYSVNGGDEPVEGSVVSEVRRTLVHIGDPETLTDMILATRAHGEPLREYVERSFASLDEAAIEQTYQRMRRQRTEAEARLETAPAFRRLAGRPALRRVA
jgi:hypothetical protein